jgi:hypothetical protein
MSGHTPTPWATSSFPEGMEFEIMAGDTLVASCSYETEPFSPVPAYCHAKANAAFIVLACNSHGELVNLLEKAALFVGWASTRSQIVAGVDAGELALLIESAVAKAKGEAL